MAQREAQKLDAGSTFPAITLDLVGGGSLSLPTEQWTVFLIYRGGW